MRGQQDKRELDLLVEEREAVFEQMSDSIWDCPELRFREERASRLQRDLLEREGFRVRSPIGTLDTAFVAEYGSGKPVIALLGEYDALPGLSQTAGLPSRKPLEEGGNGHGCGHHLLGTAAMEATVALKYWMERNGISGTVRYYGCPAEEGGCGKVHMIRAGAFRDVDVALSWHPDCRSFRFSSSRASMSAVFAFHGKSAHAATNAHLGHSALDAAELSNVGVNFLREHLLPGASVQYAFADAGSRETNIVPDYAAMEYSIRAAKRQDLEETFHRVEEIAAGAAMMTRTKVAHAEIHAAYSDILRNDTLLSLLERSESFFASADFTEADRREAESFAAAGGTSPLDEEGFPIDELRASTDFGDVTHLLPGAAFAMTTFARDTALHSWSAVAQGKLGYAHKGMHRAARILAGAAAELLRDPALVEAARREFEERTGGRPYESLLQEQKQAD